MVKPLRNDTLYKINLYVFIKNSNFNSNLGQYNNNYNNKLHIVINYKFSKPYLSSNLLPHSDNYLYFVNINL